MSFLLDTNVVSEIKKPRPNPRVSGFIASQPMHRIFLSSVTYAEIRFGIANQPVPAKRTLLEIWFTQSLKPIFAGRLLEVTEDILFEWRVLMEAGRKINHAFTQPDLIIAATALHHGLTVVTRNTGDFLRTPVPLLNPWL